MENSQRVWIMYIIVLYLNFLTVNELSTERHFIIWTAKHVYYKGIKTSKFRSKDMLLWKRVSSLVSAEDENLWIASRLVWFYGTRPPEGCCEHPPKLLYPSISRSSMKKTMPIFPNTVYKCFFTFKGEYNIDMNNLH